MSKVRVCVWTCDDKWGCREDATYETSCGNAFMLNDGTPKENKMKYCPYCGKRIKVVGEK